MQDGTDGRIFRVAEPPGKFPEEQTNIAVAVELSSGWLLADLPTRAVRLSYAGFSQRTSQCRLASLAQLNQQIIAHMSDMFRPEFPMRIVNCFFMLGPGFAR